MPNINITVESLASAIKQLNKEELEWLTILLTSEGKNPLKNKKEEAAPFVNRLT
ncbi:MAG: hypothetical protein GY754_28750 [bacterium]|nr:hypothetical protein [bacterium]